MLRRRSSEVQGAMSGQPLLSDGKENDGYMRMSAEVFAAADESLFQDISF